MNGNSGNSVPFGTPPAGFMQTGNQTFENSLTPETPSDIFGSSNPASTGAAVSDIIDPFAMASSPDFTPPTNQQEKQKYKIIDLFWLLNPKFYATPKQQPAQNEAHFVILSFNIDFGNLRVSMFNLTNNSFQNNIVFLKNLKRTVGGTIYPATAFNAFTSVNLSTICIEQLFEQIPGATWQQERPFCTIGKNTELIRFTIKDSKYGTYYYEFIGWQREAFLHACQFTFTKGFEFSAQQHINNTK